jgi:SAM-dependent methyltransferase
MSTTAQQPTGKLTSHEAIMRMREDPHWADLLRDVYVTPDLPANARRFADSPEWTETLRLLGPRVKGGVVMDLGAGNGVASWALAKAGAARVIAVEPDPSDQIGANAIRAIAGGLPIEIIENLVGADAGPDAGHLPVPDASLDAVLARQVLHHIHDLPGAMKDLARAMKPGATFVATREHVVDDEAQMAAFLAAHPVHQMTGGEHAHSLPAYLSAIRGAGLEVTHVLGPFDSIVNAFPFKRSDADLRKFVRDHVQKQLRARHGRLGAFLRGRSEEARELAQNLGREQPGRLYSFVARKPG